MGSGIAEKIKPMPFWQSLVFFGIPALLAVLAQYSSGRSSWLLVHPKRMRIIFKP